MPKWMKGASANPAGRPRGIVDKRLQMHAALQKHGTDVVAKVLELAMQGDISALKLVLDRIMPPLRPRDEPLCFPVAFEGASKGDYALAIFKQIASGALSPSDGKELLGALASVTAILDYDTLRARIEALEQVR